MGLSDYRCKNCLFPSLFFLSFILAYAKSLPGKELQASETGCKKAGEIQGLHLHKKYDRLSSRPITIDLK